MLEPVKWAPSSVVKTVQEWWSSSLPHARPFLGTVVGGVPEVSSVALTTVFAFFALVVVSMSSWGSRFWAGGGRFSPFGATSSYPAELTDDDYDYITHEQILPPQAAYDPHGPSRTPTDDRIILRFRGSSHPVYFPAYSIDSGVLTTAQLRADAASLLGVRDPNGLRLFYKGRVLRDDLRPCRDESLKIDSEVLCVLSDSPQDTEPESAEVTGSDRGESGVGAGARGDDMDRTRRKSRKRKGKGHRTEPVPAEGRLAPPEAPSEGTSRSASPAPKVAQRKLDELSTYFNAKLLPQCIEFTNHPPSDPSKRDFEHRRLAETILSDMMIKLDAVETEGDPDMRLRRKELINQAQGVLNRLDAVMKSGGA